MATALPCAPGQSSRHYPHEYDYSENYENYESYEPFHIDDLLDFDNDDIGAPIGNCDEDTENTTSVDSTEASACVSASASASASASLDGNYSTENLVTDQALVSELYVPTDALADLEWLSPYMMDDDFSSELQAVVPSFDAKTPKEDDETKARPQKNLQGCEEKPKDSWTCSSLRQWIPVRATARRSKRSRTGGRVWTNSPLPRKYSVFESHGSLFTFTSSDSSSATSRPPLKKMKASHGNSKKSQEVAPPRRCSHCLVQKTPQWRAGPHGPKTLCNACGVRYKSGRLLPEYRPAVSPTFLSDVHSNSHRKVLELRRQKDEHYKFEHIPQVFKTLANEEDEEDRREHSTVTTEDTYIIAY